MDVKYAVIGALIVLTTVNGAPYKEAPTCGYQGCPKGKPGVINVHVVPHTHDDVGWLKTVDQYYYGSEHYQKAGVQYIIDSIVRELQKNPERRFIYVEMGFFWQWWQEQSESTKTIVKQLVHEGRLEFINGGWCMNDEAATHYNDIVDQMTWGLRFLNDTFGECGRPRIAWQIDPFGHSKEQASLFAHMGFDGLFFARLDWVDKDTRLANKEMEMIWRATNSRDEGGSIFTGALYNHYSAPPGFCFDVTCNDAPIVDNDKSPEYNVPDKIGGLIEYAKKQAEHFNTDQIMFTMGDDFNYMSGNMVFKNIDKMIKAANAMDAGVHMFYSTPSCYVKAMNEAGATWPTKDDDFFPYSNDPHAYWTGYFTSRPTFKGMVRQSSNLLQSTKQMHSLAAGESVQEDDQHLIDSLRRSLGEAQHHDAVAGTEKQHVANDYALRLHHSSIQCQQDVANSLNRLLPSGNQPLPESNLCLQLNVSQCHVSENNHRFVVTAYNPRSQEVASYVRLPVTDGAYTVLDPIGGELVSQLVPITVSSSRRGVRDAQSLATHELVFQVAQLPPLGHKSFYVEKMSNQLKKPHQKTYVRQPVVDGEKVSITNGKVSVSFDGNGFIEKVSVDGQHMSVHQNLLWYKGMREKSSLKPFDERPSGAYVFRPDGTDAQPIAHSATITVQTGAVVSEVHQKFNEWASQVVRVYKGQSHVEIEWTVGPIPVEDGIGKEVVNRIATTMQSKGAFYTDSNGRQTLKRQRNYRPTWKLDVTEAVSGNYYPINSHIYLNDDDQNGPLLALVTDRSQGGTSLHDGELELMVHRRLLDDDHFGVGEPLNEPGEDGRGLIARGVHYLVVRPSLNSRPMSVIRPLAQHMFMPPLLIFSPTALSFYDWMTNFRTQKWGLLEALPANVQMLTLEPWKDGTHLLRLEHVFDVDEDAVLSQPATVNLDNLFGDYHVTWAQETTLGANQWQKDSARFSWNMKSEPMEAGQHQRQSSQSFIKQEMPEMSVTLNPMDIKSFVIRMQPRKANQ